MYLHLCLYICEYGHMDSVFFTREKKIEPEKIFNILPEKFTKLDEKKILRTVREKKLCPTKKQQNFTREKKLFAREKKSKFLPSKIKKIP